MTRRRALRHLAVLAGGLLLAGCAAGTRLGPTTGVSLASGSETSGSAASGGFTEISPTLGLSGAITPAAAGLAAGTLAVYSGPSGPLVADPHGLFSFAGGAFTALGPAFTESAPPAAIAETASGSVLAAGQSGLYTLSSGTWSLAVSASGLADVSVAPDGSFGLAVQEDGGTWIFDGKTWTPGPSLSAPLGGVAIVSATESYVVGQDLLDQWNGHAFTAITQPDPANPVAGLAIEPTASGSVLLATTRAALWQRSGATWIAVPGQASSSAWALGIPSVIAGAGVVSEVGNASPSVFLLGAAGWAAGPSPSLPVDTVAIAGPGQALAMTADGASLLALSNGAWSSITAP